MGRSGMRYYFKEKLDHYQMPKVCGGPAGRSGRGGGGAGGVARGGAGWGGAGRVGRGEILLQGEVRLSPDASDMWATRGRGEQGGAVRGGVR